MKEDKLGIGLKVLEIFVDTGVQDMARKSMSNFFDFLFSLFLFEKGLLIGARDVSICPRVSVTILS